jgi:hypothetical protein
MAYRRTRGSPIGHGRIAWLAAFHDKGNDEHNPHCHLIFRDADIETGRKVVGTTTSAKDVREAQEHGWRVPPRMTTKDLRVAWCEHHNAEMERHGLDVRSLSAAAIAGNYLRLCQIPVKTSAVGSPKTSLVAASAVRSSHHRRTTMMKPRQGLFAPCRTSARSPCKPSSTSG